MRSPAARAALAAALRRRLWRTAVGRRVGVLGASHSARPPSTPRQVVQADKGYGFVELAGGQGDAFLHANALRNASGHDVPAGAKLRVSVGAGAKGAQVTRVLEVDAAGIVERPPRPFERRAAPAPADGPGPVDGGRVTGHVKWFDDTKGFGFVASEDGGKDVFVHISILGPAGITSLAEGQQVNMRVVDTPKGREAISLSI